MNIEWKRMKCIHIGSRARFVPEMRLDVSHEFELVALRKPKGGLWASPARSRHSWGQRYRAENFSCHEKPQKFKFWVRGNVLTIDSHDDLCELPVAECFPEGATQRDISKLKETAKSFTTISLTVIIDFIGLRDSGVDAIHLTERGERNTRFGRSFMSTLKTRKTKKSSPPALESLYGWDCEAVLVLNKNCIKGLR